MKMGYGKLFVAKFPHHNYTGWVFGHNCFQEVKKYAEFKDEEGSCG
jgi:hypothetical protein